MSDGIRYEIDDHKVGWLVMDRPSAGNSLTIDCRSRMIEIFANAGSELEVRCLVLTGAGDRHFCTGGDLRAAFEPEYPEGAPEHPVGQMRRRLESSAQRLVNAMLDCDVPVVAAVNGTAAGMGAHLVFACDLVVASSTARFVEAFPRRGLVPDAGAAYLLPRLVGVQQAKRLLLLDEELSAEEAASMGLVTRVVEPGNLRNATEEWARRLASGPTVAMGLTRRMVNASLDESREAAFAREALAIEANSKTVDAAEGVLAFVERRDTEFRGW